MHTITIKPTAALRPRNGWAVVPAGMFAIGDPSNASRDHVAAKLDRPPRGIPR